MTEIAALSSQGAAATAARQLASPTLGQQDFLRLLSAQLQNQDPLKPLDNAEFLSQMAQFSTVSGIDRMNATLDGMAGGQRGTGIAMAAELLGRQVLVPGSVTRPDAAGAVHGAVTLDKAAEGLVITWSDANTGAILHSQTLGPQAAGTVEFGWPGVPADKVADRSTISLSVSALRGGATSLEAPQVYARVLSATTGAAASDVTLQVEDFGLLDGLEIERFR
jgi:flagellar basal-body rod modification protein FlgD